VGVGAGEYLNLVQEGWHVGYSYSLFQGKDMQEGPFQLGESRLQANGLKYSKKTRTAENI